MTNTVRLRSVQDGAEWSGPSDHPGKAEGPGERRVVRKPSDQEAEPSLVTGQAPSLVEGFWTDLYFSNYLRS